MLSYRLGTDSDFNWGFKPVLTYSKPQNFFNIVLEKKKKNVHLLSFTRPLRI